MSAEKSETPLSDATRRNWARLGTSRENRLCARANKRASQRRIAPETYAVNKASLTLAHTLLDFAANQAWSIENVLYAVGVARLEKCGILSAPHVRHALNAFAHFQPEKTAALPCPIPDDEFDFLGILYTLSQREGVRNEKGMYYTPRATVCDLLKKSHYADGMQLFDPCCGSGAFLLGSNAADPTTLHGMDNDPVAVMLCTINLLVRYAAFVFEPDITLGNFLQHTPARTFDRIVTNPPWGAAVNEKGKRFERSSAFLDAAFDFLAPDGIAALLLPQAFAHVRMHESSRQKLLEQRTLLSITPSKTHFNGVYCPCLTLCAAHGKEMRPLAPLMRATHCNLIPRSAADERILASLFTHGTLSLRDSVWGMGIVTGGNDEHLKHQPESDCEGVITGKDIARFHIAEPHVFLRFAPEKFQQCAAEALYRAPEKLIYRFIAGAPVFARDTQQRLVLNSANMLIAHVPNYSMTALMGLLNSHLMRYAYTKLFGGLKILKSALCALPIAPINEEEEKRLRRLSEEAERGVISAEKEIDQLIYALYGVDQRAVTYIEKLFSE